MRARVIGLGQAAAGDDGVGLAVVEGLRANGVPEDVEMLVVPEPSALIPLLETPLPVVLVDAVRGTPAGSVVDIAPDDLDATPRRALSSHGFGIAQAIEMARVLAGSALTPSIRVVGVTVADDERLGHGLSPQVAAAVPRAAAHVLALVRG